MRLGRVVVGFVGCFVSIVGCGDDSDGDGGSNGEEQGVDWSSVSPPPNIDITSCFDITFDEGGAFPSECSDCCQAAGFSAASSINDDHCTCGEAPPDDRDTVCAAEASQPTGTPCGSCCTSAGFTGHTWVGGSAPQCLCHGRADSAICAAALDHPVPDESCSYCCLENGFLSSFYVNFGGEECTCISP